MDAARTRDEALASPAQTNAEIGAVLAQAGVAPPQPTDAPDDLVKLPGGLVRGGKTLRTAVIRELTGADEEALSRALQSGSAFRFMDVLIESGTELVGNEPATRDALKALLVGDRDELALAIRCATYGDQMTIEQWTCPSCGSLSDISFSLKDDVTRVTLGDPAADSVFDVPLRKGAVARVRLPNGADQDSLFENDNWTPAERNTRLLSRCVTTITHADNSVTSVIGFPSAVRALPIPDRQKIIAEIGERQPGPRYNEIRFTHDGCKNEVTLALGVTDLFRELILFL